jgi:hypothetical protein
MKTEKDFYNLEVLKKHIEEDKDVNFFELFDYARPINHDYSHNYKSRPVFKYLLANVPDLWQKVEYKRDYKFELYVSDVREDKPLILGEKVIGIIQHYAEDKYWQEFVSKLGKDIKKYDKKDHKFMWTHAVLNYTRSIFSEFVLHEEIKKSIGEKELNDIYLTHISELSNSYRWEIDGALRECSKSELLALIKTYAEKDNFDAIETIQKNRSIQETKILPNEEVLSIKIGDQSFKEYLQSKKQEYTLHITGEDVKEGSHEEIDRLFRKNLCKDMKEHNYKLNYFHLVKFMDRLNIPNLEPKLENSNNEVKTSKKKMK